MEAVVIAGRGGELIAAALAEELAVAAQPEGYASDPGAVEGRGVAVVGPARSAALLDLGGRLRAAGAAVVGLVSPDLGGADPVAIGASFDWVVNVHDARGPLAGATVSVVADIASWLVASLDRPLFIGPDEPWLRELASALDAPPPVADPDAGALAGHTPIVVGARLDAAMLAAVRRHPWSPEQPPLCLGIHAALSDDDYRALLASGARGVISCDTVPHPSNAILLAPRVARTAAGLLRAA